MHQYESDAIVTEDGEVSVKHPSLRPGQKVHVTISPTIDDADAQQYSSEAVARSQKALEEMRQQFQVTRYDAPNEPVGVEDWEMLRDQHDEAAS